MCGIVGRIDFSGRSDPALIERMCATIEHRGPNSRGIWCHEGASLGMQRLAIIDVAGGDQPMFNEDRSVAVVMNGEIYNFPQLREELLANGHRLTTRSDTEVLVHLYEENGEELVHRLRGMFAFAIWDLRRRRLVLARDRVGKKPLFVARRGSKVWFASEVFALLQDPELGRDPNLAAIRAYLAYQYVPHPMSAFVGIEKLPPATTMVIDADGARSSRYWRLDYSTESAKIAARGVGGAPARSHLGRDSRAPDQRGPPGRLPVRRSRLERGRRRNGGSDERTGEDVLDRLSGRGLRRAPLRAASRQPLLDRPPRVIVEPHAISIMPKLARHYGEPFADPSAIPSFYLASLTSEHVTVALNGDGGDESFAGYQRYIANDRAAHFDWLPDHCSGSHPGRWRSSEKVRAATAIGHGRRGLHEL